MWTARVSWDAGKPGAPIKASINTQEYASASEAQKAAERVISKLPTGWSTTTTILGGEHNEQ